MLKIGGIVLQTRFVLQRLKKITAELLANSRVASDAKVKVLHREGKLISAVLKNSGDGLKPFEKGQYWGKTDGHAWFRVSVIIPEKIDGMGAALVFSTARENDWDDERSQFLAFVNGQPVCAMDVNHREYLLSDSVKSGEEYTADLEGFFESEEEAFVQFKCSLVGVDSLSERLYYDYRVLLESAELLDENNPDRIFIISEVEKSMKFLELSEPYSAEYYDSIKRAAQYVESEIYGKNPLPVTAHCIGHTHIDVAWLWDLEQTREKVIRSFSSMLLLLEQYPPFKFFSSQPQLYKFLKEDYPSVYEKVKELIKCGRWEADGGMWLESDCNIPSGESLIRQLVFGKRFFMEEFGVDSKILWLPDAFGYSAALPQIMEKCGIEYFMSTKISWSEVNKMPVDSFYWEGIDGTKILTHFITTTSDYDLNPYLTSYCGPLNPKHVMGSWTRYQQKELSQSTLIAYGYGDGGGGTTPEMIEIANRLSAGVPSMPQVKHSTAREFFHELEENLSGNPKTPTWVGELYLEFHRGTYTSMARNKKYNRKSENLLLSIELFGTILMSMDESFRYPKEKVVAMWECVLLNQFHDIIPGCSVKKVYEDSRKQYESLLSDGNKLLSDIQKEIANKAGSTGGMTVFSALPFESDNIIKVIGDKIPNGAMIQRLDGNETLLYIPSIPAKGFRTFEVGNGREDVQNGIIVTENLLENKFVRITFDGNMNICSFVDKRCGRELLKKGETANCLVAYEDKPYDFDAWNIDCYYKEKYWDINNVTSVSVSRKGSLQGGIKVTRAFRKSVITQEFVLSFNSAALDFITNIDFKESQTLIKTVFPLDIHQTSAVYDIQYGNVTRPTHNNTSWDEAMFEVYMHKWCDISEGNYGVSLINDCKYGGDIKGSNMRLTLLKSGIWPNPDADKEVHEFTYTLYPHMGGFREGDTVKMGYYKNNPMTFCMGGENSASFESFSFVTTDSDNIIAEVVKPTEDNDGIIIRLYECYNQRTDAVISINCAFKSCVECDMLERETSEIIPKGNKIGLRFLPYEIKTLRLKK